MSITKYCIKTLNQMQQDFSFSVDLTDSLFSSTAKSISSKIEKNLCEKERNYNILPVYVYIEHTNTFLVLSRARADILYTRA